jgi:phosphatidylserine/phosphatidylglycerophosphate/cardiolipin synthase-like enzyme
MEAAMAGAENTKMNPSVFVYFNRPGFPVDLSLLLGEIESSRQSIIIASAWFTDTHIAAALVRSPAARKILISNRSDLTRGNRKAYQMCYDAPDIAVYALGSENWQEGVMHHKFIVTDEAVWLGSYNFTYQARSNYENLVRIAANDVRQAYIDECETLLSHVPQMYAAGDLTGMECRQCRRWTQYEDLVWVDTGPPMCPVCGEAYYAEEQKYYGKDASS